MNTKAETYLPWFILRQIPCLGNQLTAQLIQTFGTPENILCARSDALQCVDGIGPGIAGHIQAHDRYRPAALAELNRIKALGLHILTLNDPLYPALLRQIPDPPAVLTYIGSVDPIAPCIAIVGSRRATAYGLNTAGHLAASLARRGFTVASGMARGIDTAAHKGALNAGGNTVAVLGSGLNQIYPKENKALFFRIRNHGAVVSEFLPDAPPLARHFPVRNRLIAGISVGTLVVEAAAKSGSLITARLAGEYNREVFAVPGSIISAKSRGTHALLKQGAKLVENEMDIVDELHQFVHPAPDPGPVPEKKTVCMDKTQGLVYNHLEPYPRHIDAIIESTGMDSGTVAATLLDLELSGLIQRHPGNYYSISEEKNW